MSVLWVTHFVTARDRLQYGPEPSPACRVTPPIPPDEKVRVDF